MTSAFPLSLTLFCVWVVVAAVIAVLPGRFHWRAAYALIAVVVPLIGYLWWELGVWYALSASLAAMSVLRWPVRFLARWLRARIGGQGG